MIEFRLDSDCKLRVLEETDTDELHRVVEDNRAYLSRWMPWAAGQTPEHTLAFIRVGLRQLVENNGFQLAIVCGGRIVGNIGFHRIDRVNLSTSIGYWLAEDAQGRGTMTAAVRALLEHAFDVWRLNRVEIRAAPDNARSRAIPERLGFHQEGTLRQAERIGNRFHDNVVYSLLADEWRKSR